jgi:antitoxin MazE
MKVKLVPIGNSKGVRIPRSVIQECAFGDEVDLSVKNGAVVLAPARQAREGWDKAFAKATKGKDQELLVPDDLAHSWDEEEWTW